MKFIDTSRRIALLADADRRPDECGDATAIGFQAPDSDEEYWGAWIEYWYERGDAK